MPRTLIELDEGGNRYVRRKSGKLHERSHIGGSRLGIVATRSELDVTNLARLPTWADKEHVHAVVETPGSPCKLEFDPRLKVFTLSKPLLAGLTYPYDWRFVPSTKAEDGDPQRAYHTRRRDVSRPCASMQTDRRA